MDARIGLVFEQEDALGRTCAEFREKAVEGGVKGQLHVVTDAASRIAVEADGRDVCRGDALEDVSRSVDEKGVVVALRECVVQGGVVRPPLSRPIERGDLDEPAGLGHADAERLDKRCGKVGDERVAGRDDEDASTLHGCAARQDFAPDARPGVHEVARDEIGLRLARNAQRDAERLHELLIGRQNVARAVMSQENGHAQAVGQLGRKRRAQIAVERKGQAEGIGLHVRDYSINCVQCVRIVYLSKYCHVGRQYDTIATL